MEKNMFIPIVKKREERLSFYITTIGITREEKIVYRPDGITSWQILYSEKGCGIVKIYDDVYRMLENMFMVLPPDTPHESV